MPTAIYWKNGERREQHCADEASKACLEASYPDPTLAVLARPLPPVPEPETEPEKKTSRRSGKEPK
jgi:hypothetical protein